MADKPKLPDWFDLAKLTPKEAFDFFAAKKPLPSFRWQDVWAKEHATAATVAGMMSEDLLATVMDYMAQAIGEGKDSKWFEDQLTPILEKAGWWGKQEITDPTTGETRNAQLGSPSRLQLIYDVNMRSAYAAGRWEQGERTKRTAPLLLYRTMRDERVRKSHADWDGVVLPRDDPFWDTHYPPNGYRCRCIATPISEAGVRDLVEAGKKIKRRAPKVTEVEYTRNGETIKLPAGIDPGFGYNVGKERQRSLEEYKGYQRKQLPEAVRKAAEKRDRKPKAGT